jgi:hypothetical protein
VFPLDLSANDQREVERLVRVRDAGRIASDRFRRSASRRTRSSHTGRPVTPSTPSSHAGSSTPSTRRRQRTAVGDSIPSSSGIRSAIATTPRSSEPADGAGSLPAQRVGSWLHTGGAVGRRVGGGVPKGVRILRQEWLAVARGRWRNQGVCRWEFGGLKSEGVKGGRGEERARRRRCPLFPSPLPPDVIAFL